MSDRLGAKTLRIDPTQFGGYKHGQEFWPNPVYSLETILERDEEFVVENCKGNLPCHVRQTWEEIAKGDMVQCKSGAYFVESVVLCRTGRNIVFVVPNPYAIIQQPD